MDMEVGITVYLKNKEMLQGIIQMPSSATIPLEGDKLLFNGVKCHVTEREFVAQKKEGSNIHYIFGWSITGREP
ncbi:MAG: hypothetical protein ACYC2J_11225 [Acidithiobacillus ferrooxidans]